MPPTKPQFSADLPADKRGVLERNAELYLDTRNRYPEPDLIARWESMANGEGAEDLTDLDRRIMSTMGYSRDSARRIVQMGVGGVDRKVRLGIRNATTRRTGATKGQG